MIRNDPQATSSSSTALLQNATKKPAPQQQSQSGLRPKTVSSTSSLESDGVEKVMSATSVTSTVADKNAARTIDAILSSQSESFLFPDELSTSTIYDPVANPLENHMLQTPRAVEDSPPLGSTSVLYNEPPTTQVYSAPVTTTTLVPPDTTKSAPKNPPIVASLVPTYAGTTTSNARVSTVPSLPTPVPIMPSSIQSVGAPPAAVPQPNNNTVAEFLYQLTKMLTDDNKEVIEWSNGKIEVHNPHRLASEVLHRYFRHSKFASFQRQLNYFGFRKLAGKGKMAPCSYVNEATTDDLRSILAIKRKTSATTGKGGEKGKKRERTSSTAANANTAPVNPVLAGILQRTADDSKRSRKGSTSVTSAAVGQRGIKHQLNGFLKKPAAASGGGGSSHAALAKAAVGKGVRHGYSVPPISGAPAPPVHQSQKPSFTFQDPHQLGMDIQTSLSELSNNYQNSLKDAAQLDDMNSTFMGGASMLKRNDSLVDLAMLPEPSMSSLLPQSSLPDSSLDTKAPATAGEPQVADSADINNQGGLMSFVDFPHEELIPKSSANSDHHA